MMRNEEEIDETLKYAKINKNDLVSRCQCICFASPLDLNAYKLLEVNSDLLQHLENGEKLTVRGNKDDMAVICTDSATYSVKEAEISNSMLILPDLEFKPKQIDTPGAIVGNCRVYWELKEEKIIKFHRLRELLSENPYCGPEKENDRTHERKKYTLHDLLELIPASEQQILNYLHSVKVCLINGYYRLLDFDYIVRLLTEITNVVEENSWSWRAINFTLVTDSLSDLEPPVVVRKWFELYCDPNIDDTWRLNETNVCKLHAEMLLHSVEKFHLKDFKEAWRGSVPEEMKPKESMLRGLAIVDKDSKPPFVQYMPEGDLPDTASERFDKLFSAKQKWSLEELSPYLETLVSNKADVGTLLMKYCRCSTVGDVKVYTSKRAFM